VTGLKLNGTAATPCLNAPPIPAPANADPQFLITPKDSSQSTRSDTLRYTDAVQAIEPALDFNSKPIYIAQNSARVTGNWFVTQSTPAGGTTTPEWQSLSIHYVDWNWRQHTAWLRPNDDGSYSFLVAAANRLYEGSPGYWRDIVDPNSCLAEHRCALTDSINYQIFSSVTNDNVQRLTAKLVPAVAPTISVTLPDTVTEGSPATLSATATGGTGGAVSYEWYLETTSRHLSTCSGQKFCGYNGPYRGDHIEYTFQAPGPRKGILLATETGGGRTYRKDFTVDVAGVPPTLTVDSNSSSVSFGDSTTITGTVAHAGADDFETVTVDWGDGSSDTGSTGLFFCSPTCPKVTFLPRSGTEYGFTGTHTYAHAGRYTITVTVTDGVGGRDSATAVREMTVAATTTSLTASTTTPQALQPVTYTVTVDSPKAAPTGQVHISDEATDLPVCDPGPLPAGGPYTVTCQAAFPTPGSYTVLASYEGDPDTAGSNNSPGITLTVGKADQAITFTSLPPADATVGDTYTLSATGGGSGEPVTFRVDPSTTDDACTLDGATVTFTHQGRCVIAADQAGNDIYQTAPTATQSTPVQAIGTTLDVTTGSANSVFGEPVTPTATVAEADSTTPAGTVQFAVDGTAVGGPVSVTGGHAVGPALATLPIGPHQITATFTPSDPTVYAPAQAETGLVVDKAATEIALTVHRTALSATVTATPPGAGTPTGTLTFLVDGNAAGSAPLSSGAATLPSAMAPGQNHEVAAVYGGDSHYTGSSASTTRRDPSITAAAASTQPKSRYGWYRTPVTVTFTCTPSSAPLTAACPAPVELTGNRAAQSVTRTITATDGGAASVTVNGINIDTRRPTVRVIGVRDGGVYAGTAPPARCVAHDLLSGIASCRIQKTRRGAITRFIATATDRAGNTRSVRGSYRVLTAYLQGVPYRGGAFQVRVGQTYTLTVVKPGTRPRYYGAAPYPQAPGERGPVFHRAGGRTWTLGVTLPRSMRQYLDWNLGILIGTRLRTIPLHVNLRIR
jgi:hypothetical protein